MGPRIFEGRRRRIGCTVSETLYEAVREKAARSGGTLSGALREALLGWVSDDDDGRGSSGGPSG